VPTNIPKGLIRALRPKQWTKNLLVFAGLLFSRQYSDPDSVLRACATFAAFCLLSGAVYIINDLVDVEEDRLHPRKRNRPIASGQLPMGVARVAAMLLAPIALLIAFHTNWATGIVCASYFANTLLYNLTLKHRVIWDVLSVSGGFVLRAVAGVTALDAAISPWLLICTLLLALFLTLTKRRQELVLLENGAGEHRRILEEYSPQLLDQMISVVTASTLMSYCLYTISERTVREFGNHNLLLTIPFVIYGIFRYLYLVHQKDQGDAPDRVFLSDTPMLVNVALYIAVVVLILLFGGGPENELIPS
jgi:4-hydroxybenzoate polyprenyltransferase